MKREAKGLPLETSVRAGLFHRAFQRLLVAETPVLAGVHSVIRNTSVTERFVKGDLRRLLRSRRESHGGIAALAREAFERHQDPLRLAVAAVVARHEHPLDLRDARLERAEGAARDRAIALGSDQKTAARHEHVLAYEVPVTIDSVIVGGPDLLGHRTQELRGLRLTGVDRSDLEIRRLLLRLMSAREKCFDIENFARGHRASTQGDSSHDHTTFEHIASKPGRGCSTSGIDIAIHGAGGSRRRIRLGLRGGLNAYGFAGGDPINFSDPFGLCPIPVSDCPLGYFAAALGTTGAVAGGIVGGA